MLLLAAVSALACAGEHGGAASAAACAAPDTTTPPRVDPAHLRGAFTLSMHVTAGLRPDSVVEARLWLRPGGRAGSSIPSDLPWIVEGRTTLAITSAAPAMNDPSGAVLTSDSAAPRHVVGFWDPRERSIALLRTRGPGDDTTRVQRGVALRVRETSPDGFRGTWHTAFWRPPLPSGYFCALRVGDESSSDEQRTFEKG